MTNRTVKLLSHQYTFLDSFKKYYALISGIGAGKTAAGALYIINRALNNPETLGLVAQNSYAQLRNVTVREITKWLEDFGIKYTMNWNTRYLTLHHNKAKILCVSMDNFNLLRGVEIGYFLLDEARDTKKEAFEVLIGRLRCMKSHRLEGRIVTSPNGFDWIYDRFAGDKTTKEFGWCSAKSFDNIYLPKEYLDSLVASYDSKFAQQELYGEFINLTAGSVYHAFNRGKNVKPVVQSDNAIKYVAMDFNISPMCAIHCYMSQDKIYVYDETILRDANTYMMADRLVESYGRKLRIVPDSTGKARKTSSVRSDHQILEDKGFVIEHTSNPHVKDRYNCVNGLFERERIIIDPRCKFLIRDLEQFTYENTDKDLSHASDALGYMAWKFFPLKKQTPQSKVIGF